MSQDAKNSLIALANVIGFIGLFALALWAISDVQLPNWVSLAAGVVGFVNLVIFGKGLFDRREKGSSGDRHV